MAYQFIFFVITYVFKFDQVTDFAGQSFIPQICSLYASVSVFLRRSQDFFFFFSFHYKVYKLVYVSGSTNFVILAVLTLVLKATWHFRQVHNSHLFFLSEFPSLFFSHIFLFRCFEFFFCSLEIICSCTDSLVIASYSMGTSLGDLPSNEVSTKTVTKSFLSVLIIIK